MKIFVQPFHGLVVALGLCFAIAFVQAQAKGVDHSLSVALSLLSEAPPGFLKDGGMNIADVGDNPYGRYSVVFGVLDVDGDGYSENLQLLHPVGE